MSEAEDFDEFILAEAAAHPTPPAVQRRLNAIRATLPVNTTEEELLAAFQRDPVVMAFFEAQAKNRLKRYLVKCATDLLEAKVAAGELERIPGRTGKVRYRRARA